MKGTQAVTTAPVSVYKSFCSMNPQLDVLAVASKQYLLDSCCDESLSCQQFQYWRLNSTF